MASLSFATVTLSCASSKTIPKFSAANSLSNSRYLNSLCPLLVLNANSAILINSFRIQPCDLSLFRTFQKNTPLIVCLSTVVARAYTENDYANSPDDDDGQEDREQDSSYLTLDSESLEDGIEIEIDKTGKNSRRIRSKVVVQASLQTVWDILTDYERLADFIPGLAVSQLLEKGENFARLYQVGQQDLAFGLKFNAKGTIDCFEKDIQTLPFGQKRDIEFKMVEGDFLLFEGKWSVEQNDSSVDQESQTTLVYIVDVKPKMWLPVRLVEDRLCREIRTNLSCIREEAEKAYKTVRSAV